jgi:uncharacterized protein (DUF983 family)
MAAVLVVSVGSLLFFVAKPDAPPWAQGVLAFAALVSVVALRTVNGWLPDLIRLFKEDRDTRPEDVRNDKA